MNVYGCHGDGYDVTTSLKVLPDKRVLKIFIDCPHAQKYFFVIFSRFKGFITFKNPFRATLILKQCLLITARLTCTRVFFLGKCVRTTAKTMVVDRK